MIQIISKKMLYKLKNRQNNKNKKKKKKKIL